MALPPVLVVSLATSGHCAQARESFWQRGGHPTVSEFDTAGSDLKRRPAADMRAHRIQGSPFVIIGGRAVGGYDPHVCERLLSMD